MSPKETRMKTIKNPRLAARLQCFTRSPKRRLMPYWLWQWKRLFAVIAFIVSCQALYSPARAVNPPPDGGYPNDNTAEGSNALFSLDTRTASGNTAIGQAALLSTTTGNYNTASGAFALSSNKTGSSNTANGYQALGSNGTGSDNTANGFQALNFNKTGSFNAANGHRALSNNTTGNYNTANGVS